MTNDAFRMALVEPAVDRPSARLPGEVGRRAAGETASHPRRDLLACRCPVARLVLLEIRAQVVLAEFDGGRLVDAGRSDEVVISEPFADAHGFQPGDKLHSQFESALADREGARPETLVIHPGDAADKDLYDLPAEEALAIPTVCHSLDMALEALDADRDFLTAGDVFTNDLIDGYIDLKMEEVTQLRMTTHPVEFDLYFSL